MKKSIAFEKKIIKFKKHLDVLRKRVDTIEKYKRLTKNSNSNSDLKEWIEIENLDNYQGYLTISYLDLLVNLKNISKTTTEWEKIFFIKNSYLVIHETLNKLNNSKNKNQLEESIKKDYPSLLSDFNNLMNEISVFKNNTDYNRIEKVRHHTAGHIVDSLKRYYDTVEALNIEVAKKNIIDFMNIHIKALELTKDLAFLKNKRSVEKNKVLKKEVKELKEKLERLNKQLEPTKN